jgi:hypothetical protein
VGKSLAAKESLFVEDEYLKESFHKSFCETQVRAREMASRFNSSVRNRYLSSYNESPSTIEFLSCYVYILSDPSDPEYVRGVLVEELLDKSKYKKWNNNNGYVIDQKVDQAPKAQAEWEDPWEGRRERVVRFAEEVTILGEDDYDEDSSEEEFDVIEINKEEPSVSDFPVAKAVPPADFLQAFSHWTYFASGRSQLVCDLQGVFEEHANRFKLTDPVIHYKGRTEKSKKKKNRFGRSDLGEAGMNQFFLTHVCNPICSLLGLPKHKSKNYKNQ